MLQAEEQDAPSKRRGGNTSAQAQWLRQTFKQMLNELAGAKQRGEVELTFAPDALTEQLRKAAADAIAKPAAAQNPASFMTPNNGTVWDNNADDSVRQKAAKIAQQLV